MMKRIFKLTLTILLISSIFTTSKVKIEGSVKDFLTGFFKTLNGEFTLNEQCFGDETIKAYERLIKAFKDRNPVNILKALKDKANLTMDHCPIAEIENYINQRNTAIKEGFYFENFKKNLKNIGMVIFEVINNFKIKSYDIGVACGKITKMVIFKNTSAQYPKFLLNDDE
jgi:hypothetical protein